MKPITISSGTMEGVNWLGLITMTIDHMNRFFYHPPIYAAYCIGRLALPLFAFIFAYNLANPKALEQRLHGRILKRLFLFGLLATPGYIAMRHLPLYLPLNIMFSLAAATAVVYFLDLGGFGNRIAAMIVFFLSGFLVEYNWAGIFFCITAWLFCRKPSLLRLFLWLLAYLYLNHLNGNGWAFLSLGIFYLAPKIKLSVPRIPYFFYVYYPLHLSILYLLS